MAEVAHGEVVHAVAALADVERVRHQHGVVEGGDADAVLGEHIEIVFQVLPDLQDRRVLEQRLQKVERLAQRNLGQHVAAEVELGRGATMGERHVGGLARRDRQREADELGLHRVDRRRLGVEGDTAGGASVHDPSREAVGRRHRLVFGTVEGSLGGSGGVHRRGAWGFSPRHRRRALWRSRRLPLARNRGADRGLDRSRRLGAEALRDAPRQRVELHQSQEAQKRRRIGIDDAEMLERHADVDVLLEADQLTRYARLVGELDELLAALGLLDLGGAREQRVEVAVLVDELGCGLDADARHARHVVGRIAGKRLHVDDLLGRHAELLHHLLAPELLALHGVEHDDAGAHELHQVLVGGDDRHVAAGIDHVARVGGDEVVGLVALLLDAGHVESFDRITDERELRHELVGRRRPVRLVGFVDLVAEILAAGIEHDRDVGRRLGCLGLAQELPQHGAEAVHRADGDAV